MPDPAVLAPRQEPPVSSTRERYFAPSEPIGGLDHMLQSAIVEANGGFSPISLWRAWADWGLHLAVSPGRQLELAAEAFKAGLAANAADRRFADEAWRQWPFSLWAAQFQSVERLWDEATRNLHGADPHSLALVNFLGRQALDAVAPTNFLATNPVALAQTFREGGANLWRGASNFAADFARLSRGERPEAAKVWAPGKTVALTPGVVVKRTHLAELIYYRPTTAKVRPEPVVITPAWIMKYYILDLTPPDSLIKALVDAGFSVFVVSWRNPTREDRDIGFEDYAELGVLPAISTALELTGGKRAHLVGYCIGGALAAVVAAAMARDLDDRLQTLTLLAAQVDYTEAGELRLFIDHSQLAAIEDVMWEEGAFEGARMGGAFNLLRSNDLIWSQMIHHYLMGEPETMDALSAWSTDTTRLPYRMHRDYLRQFYLDNDFAEGRFALGGRSVSPRDIRLPLFALGTETDHVAPWRSVFKIHQFAGADVTFALTNGGHNRGVVCPPGSAHRHFRLATTSANAARPDPAVWFAATAPREGSWWGAWFDWLGARSGALQAPPPVRTDALAPAPGTYVFDAPAS